VSAAAPAETTQPPVSPQALMDLVARAYAVSPGEMLSTSRHAEVVIARQVAMYLCSALWKLPDEEVAFLWNRERSTATWARRKVRDLMSIYPEVRTKVESLMAALTDRSLVEFNRDIARTTVRISVTNLTTDQAALVHDVVSILTDPSRSADKAHLMAGASVHWNPASRNLVVTPDLKVAA